MTSLNNITFDKPYSKTEPEILIELPQPKKFTDNCTIIMNGHHNYSLADEKYNGAIAEGEEETEPFLNSDRNHVPSNQISESIPSSNPTVVSSNMFPLKESAPASSADEDSDVEQESSTHLLQSEKQDISSVKCLKNKPKIATLKCSPSKRQASNGSHSHIQHQPLIMSQSSKPSSFFHKWSMAHVACVGFLVFLLLGIICIVVGLYLTAPTDCNTHNQWWQSNAIYEIFPASFQDSDGDGFGDIRGIIERLEYIQNLSINVIRLNSIFSALDYPLEYEHIIDFANIDPHLGRVEDFEELVKEVHSRGMYIILDINPTVTSDQHTWAAHWLLHRPGRYEHFYINTTDEKEDPPLESNPEYTENGWPPPHRTFGNHFTLNWSHPLLQLEMKNVMELWLSIGVDGYYVKHIESMQIQNRAHWFTIMHQWRYILDKYSVNTTRKVLMMSHSTLKFLNSAMDPVKFVAIPSMVDLIDASVNLIINGSAIDIGEDIENVRKFWDQYPASPAIDWHIGSAETMRLAGRVGRGSNMAGILLISILPGSFSAFYGDEIGLQNSFNMDTEKVYRGGQFTPMQWTSGPQSNFTSDDTSAWLPVHPSYLTLNVDTEEEKLQIFKTLIELKRGGKLFPPEPNSSMLHNLIMRLSGNFGDNPEYQWYYNLCGLIVVKTIKGSSEYMYIGNFGYIALSFTDEEECVGGNFVFSLYPWKNVEVFISTNTALKGTVELQQLLLEPGDSVIGRLIT